MCEREEKKKEKSGRYQWVVEGRRVFRGASSRRESVKVGNANPKNDNVQKERQSKGSTTRAAADRQYVIVGLRVFSSAGPSSTANGQGGGDGTERCR